jgi:caffeoyl-CoA O-methyltransferase
MVPEKIENYAASRSIPESEVFKNLVTDTHARSDRAVMQVGKLEGACLRILAASIGAKRVLEIGTFTGYSTLCLAEAIPDGGKVITCDIDEETTSIAREHWDRSPHGKKIELRLGPALETIAKLEGEFDFAFIDADKINYPNYWKAISPRIRPGGMIVIDNVLWSGRVAEPNPDEDTRAIMEATKLAYDDSAFQTVLLTVRDGMLVALKKKI